MNPTAKRRLLIVLPWSPFGVAGAELVVINIANQLVKDFDIYMVAVSSADDVSRSSLSPEITFRVIKVKKAKHSILELRKVIKEFKPDLIWGNVLHICTNALIAKFLLRPSTPFISTNHGMAPDIFIEKVHLYFTYLLSSQIVVVSEGIRQGLQKYFHLSSRKIVTIYNGFDFNTLVQKSLETLSEQEVVWDRARKTVIGVGRFVEQKSFDVLIKAVQILVTRHHKDVNLLLLGDGILKSQIQQQVQDLNLKDRVYFLGWQDNPLKYVKNADVFVLSSYFEGFGNVIVEALASGTPVVSTDCPSGPAEILQDGKYGRLVPVADADKMAAEIANVLEMDKDSARLQERAKDFAIEKTAESYRTVFAKYLAQ